MREAKEAIHLKAYSTINRGQPHHIAQCKLFLTWSENYRTVHDLIRCLIRRLFEIRTVFQQDHSLFHYFSYEPIWIFLLGEALSWAHIPPET